MNSRCGHDREPTSLIAGAGGNVKYISPVAAFRQFYPIKGLKLNPEGRNVLGMRLQLAHISGFGGQVAPPTNRIYGGGENDVRGFQFYSITPVAYIPSIFFALPPASAARVASSKPSTELIWPIGSCSSISKG